MMQKTIAGFSKAAVVATRTHGSRRCLSMVISGPSIVTSVLLISFTIHDDTCFSLSERNRLGLRSLLPPRGISFGQLKLEFL
ncbi:hypothetical protein DY000_02025040 [Brassica cretica]|uniref:Uncharacterized protein n=1 Tax=Brassica cretica TaxID=69181 RepID=A0ABQ7EHD0_BRACR|nr:hypothetical protein DY000_02025040 [Brassica cretica]